MVEILRSKGENSEGEILKFEKELGYKLPCEYRDFLLKYNGGQPLPNVIHFKENGYDSNTVIDCFLSLCETEDKDIYHDLLWNYKCCTDEQTVPYDMLPIADDLFGNPIVIALSGMQKGHVYFVNHEVEIKLNMSHIANSFNRFLNLLTSN